MKDYWPKYAILHGREAYGCSMPTWAKWLGESMERVVATTGNSEVLVSTVFLGLNHQCLPGGPPLWFETMVFGGPLDRETERYTTYDQAEEGHRRMAARAFPALARPKRRSKA